MRMRLVCAVKIICKQEPLLNSNTVLDPDTARPLTHEIFPYTLSL
jgi:hypothetical protein